MLLSQVNTIMDAIGEIVSNYAFPIVMCILLFKQNEAMSQTFEKLVEALINQQNLIKENEEKNE